MRPNVTQVPPDGDLETADDFAATAQIFRVIHARRDARAVLDDLLGALRDAVVDLDETILHLEPSVLRDRLAVSSRHTRRLAMLVSGWIEGGAR